MRISTTFLCITKLSLVLYKCIYYTCLIQKSTSTKQFEPYIAKLVEDIA